MEQLELVVLESIANSKCQIGNPVTQLDKGCYLIAEIISSTDICGNKKAPHGIGQIVSRISEFGYGAYIVS